MIETWGDDFRSKTLLSGGSAGAVFALGIALGKSPNYMSNLYRTVSEKCKKHGTLGNCSYFLEEELLILLEDPLAYKQIEGKCVLGTTAYFSKHRWHLSWGDNKDLLTCIKGSCHIPLYCGYGDRVMGVEVVDGAYAFSGEHLPHGDDTLYVGIDPHAEITREFTNTEMVFPSVGEDFDNIVESGYKAFLSWNGNMNKKVGKRLPNYQALIVLWILKFIEIVVVKLKYVCNFFRAPVLIKTTRS